MGMTNINIACGNTFIASDAWINFDYNSSCSSVQKVDLLKGLPLDNDSISVVYSSHFLEHISRSKTLSFLQDCHRVLIAGGKIRLVLPDWENLCREYLKCRDQGENDKANFTMIEMIDQCVRLYPGGLLGDYLDYLKKHSDEQSKMIEYVKLRCGEDLSLVASNLYSESSSREGTFFQKLAASKLMRAVTSPNYLTARLKRKFSHYRIKLATALLPKAFREQNVSYASVGERHAWMWDFYTLSQELERAGFHNIKRLSFDKTEIDNFPLVPLDRKSVV